VSRPHPRPDVKTFYQLLEIAPSAGADEVKRAFRVQIARYHPDKVQHLGREFQEMAAKRAAELTEAYRILSSDHLRAEYDRALVLNRTVPAPPASSPPEGRAGAPSTAGAPLPDPPPDGRSAGDQPFSRELASRDRVVRRAMAGRLDQALALSGGGYDRVEARAFDFAWLPKSRLFGRGKGPRLAGRLVPRVDGASVAAAFADAGKWAGTGDVCVFLMGDDLATAGELARAIADQRRRSGASRVTVIPLDARTWDAHVPTEAPPHVKTVLERLKTGT
jgi:curved DNA-binding protein CbpA